MLGALVLLSGLALPARASEADACREKALALNDVTGNEAIEGQVRSLIDNPDDAQKLLAAAVRLAKAKHQPFNYNAALILAVTARELHDVKAAQTFFTICAKHAVRLQSGQKLVESLGGLVDLLYENKQYDEVITVCQQFVSLQGNEAVERAKPVALERLIQALTRKGNIDDALKLTDQLIQLEKQQGGWTFLQVKGWVLYEAGKLEEAAQTYENVLKCIRKDTHLEKDQQTACLEEARYVLSGIYTDLHEVDKAAKHLRRLLKAQPDNPEYNNDLGYLWATHDQNLEEAETLIRKAIDLDRKQRQDDPEYDAATDKDNADYLDSLGWVLFKQKKYVEAEQYLREAVKDKDGQNIEIFDHLGDVLLARNKKKAAIHAWKHAIDSAGEVKREQDLKAKIEEKLQALEKE
jgi:tetratricopeptide (TPR) repeat protein